MRNPKSSKYNQQKGFLNDSQHVKIKLNEIKINKSRERTEKGTYLHKLKSNIRGGIMKEVGFKKELKNETTLKPNGKKNCRDLTALNN